MILIITWFISRDWTNQPEKQNFSYLLSSLLVWNKSGSATQNALLSWNQRFWKHETIPKKWVVL